MPISNFRLLAVYSELSILTVSCMIFSLINIYYILINIFGSLRRVIKYKEVQNILLIAIALLTLVIALKRNVNEKS